MNSSPSPADLATPPVATADPISGWERAALALVLLVALAAGFSHVHANTIFGQDFGLHEGATADIIKDLMRWFPQDFTNRPMIYWLGAAGNWLTHGKATFEVAGCLCVVMNALALFFVHASLRHFITSPWLRVSAVAFVAFLPTTLVTTVVYAGDATGQLPFALTIWALLRTLDATTARSRVGFAALTAFGMCLGNFSRFPFIVLPVAILVTLFLVWRTGRLPFTRALLIALIALVPPVLTSAWIHRQAQLQLQGMEERHTHDWNGTGEMSWRYLLLPVKNDLRILNAPSYWDDYVTHRGEEVPFMTVPHNYSYPGLLHLGLYSDILNYADQGQLDNGKPRPEPQKTLCCWAVRIGVVTSLGIFLAVLALIVRSVAAIRRRPGGPTNGALLWGMMTLAWFLPIVLAFPYVHFVYESGYFLTRLILPAIWGFGVLLFAEADLWLARRPRWLTVAVAAFIAAQAAVHLRSVWY